MSKTYIEFYISLPPSHMEVYKQVLEDNRIDSMEEISKMQEDDFRKLDGITPLMVDKTKEALGDLGFHFGMTDEEIIQMKDEIYFKDHKDERFRSALEQHFLHNYKIKRKNHKQEEECDFIQPVEITPLNLTTDILSIINDIPTPCGNVEEVEDLNEAPSVVIPSAENDIDIAAPDMESISSEENDTDTKAKLTAEKNCVEQQIKELEHRQYDYLSPLLDSDKTDLEYFRTFAILDALREDPWYIKLFKPYQKRVHDAIAKGNYVFEKWLEDAKTRHKEVIKMRENIQDQLCNSRDKRYELQKKINELP